MYAITGCIEHPHGGARIFRLEIARKRVDEQDNVRARISGPRLNSKGVWISCLTRSVARD